MTDRNPEHRAAMDALLRRAAADERFVGWALARVGPADPAALAARLGCPPESLRRLALCRRPEEVPERFAVGVREIAAHAGCDPAALRDLLREAAAVERLRGPDGATDVGRGLLLAARDRERAARETPPAGNSDDSRDPRRNT
jgi:hypothetical protein